MKTIIILSHVVFDDSPYCIFVHEHAKALKRLGYNVIVFAMLNWFPFISNIKKERKRQYKEKKGAKIIDGVTVIYKKRLSFSNLLANSKINLNGISYYCRVKRQIKKMIKENDVLFIDAHMFKIEGYVAAKLHRKFGVNTTVTCHGTSLIRATESKNAEHIINSIMSNINYAICVSNLLENKLKNFNFLNTKVIYNGINFYEIEETEKDEITILTVATLIKRKNIDLIIKSFREISTRFKNIKLVIVGQGIEEQKLKAMVQKLKLEKSIKFLGQIENKEVYKLMKSSKIFLLPSVGEGFGIVYAEAMYNGCITVGTKGEGIDGFIQDGVNGFLVKPEENDIVEKLNYILENEDNLTNIIQTAKEDTKALTWENNAKSYIELWKREMEK